ncbi:MAG: prepilin-type N-terminal cleavage/methylation domain-containing protein [SAR324 cluster bacterium]|nr:prepilin-type N-terminal cleavage/methylation domain-containing protein [SAR324 cluster bacterium]
MKLTRKQLRKYGGFSLVEIIIAIAIIGIMSAAAVPLIRASIDKSRNTRIASELEDLRNATITFLGDNLENPGTQDCNGTADGANKVLLSSNQATWVGATGVLNGDDVEDLDSHLSTGEAAGGIAGDTGSTACNALYTTGDWKGPYVRANDTTDPWGQPVVLLVNGYTTANRSLAVSAGADETLDTDIAGTTAVGDDIAIPIILQN